MGETARSSLRFERGVALPKGTKLALPESLRARLAEPSGEVFAGDELPARTARSRGVAAVGDMTAAEAIRRGAKPRYIVVDFKTRRGAAPPDDVKLLKGFGARAVTVVSPPAVLTHELYNAVLEAAASRATTRIEVEGEEDLAVLPSLIHLEEGATVLYGIPDQGLVAVTVDPESRRLAREFLDAFHVVEG